MRAKTDLHRALVRTSLGFHRQMETRRENVHHDQFAEREQQFQHEIRGTIGATGAELTLVVGFDVTFPADPGVRRDSQLGEPCFRPGFRLDVAPKGTVPYAFVKEWVLDDDLNFTGAKVNVGLHNVLGAVGRFSGLVHLAFQGYGSNLEEYEATGAGGSG